jgi:RNA polymerase sigma-70 factor (ECF subfamily)
MSRTPRPPRAVRAVSTDHTSADSAIAAEVKALVLAGDRDAARHRFGDLVNSQQRRAVRLAFHFLRDAHDADEAVQDAFVKVFTHITSYREDLPFEVWFTRILVNACLDLRKARSRRLRWVLPIERHAASEAPASEVVDRQPSTEDRLVGRVWMKEIAAAVDRLPERQRTVFMLSQVADQTTTEISQALGLSEATVRVHLFRAIRKLRTVLEREKRGPGKRERRDHEA